MEHFTFSGKIKALRLKVFIHFEDDHVEAQRLFADCEAADTYFDEALPDENGPKRIGHRRRSRQLEEVFPG